MWKKWSEYARFLLSLVLRIMTRRRYNCYPLSNPVNIHLLLLLLVLNRTTVNCKQRYNNFRVFWNVPTFMCHKYGYNFTNVQDEWGIIQNFNDEFRGDKIAILYDPGLFPALLNTTSGSPQELRNGGVPQEGDLDLHLFYLKQDIEKLIPDKDFHGVGIIDFEQWRPIWRENWGSLNSYRVYSRQIEKKNHPWWTDSMIEKEATTRFEKASQQFMDKSLEVIKSMRPLAIWGYYGYPFCFNFTPKNNKYTCSDDVVVDNNRLNWLFKGSSALYPSMYLKNKGMTEATRANFILGRMQEANRISQKYSYIPIFPYTWYKYHDANRFLSREDLKNSFEIPRRNGAAGVIIWGATNDVNSKDKCAAVFDYLERFIGPTIQEIKKKFKSFTPYVKKKILNDVISVDDNIQYNEIDTLILV